MSLAMGEGGQVGVGDAAIWADPRRNVAEPPEITCSPGLALPAMASSYSAVSEQRRPKKGWHPPRTIWHLPIGFECDNGAVIHSILVKPILMEESISRVSSSPQW